MNIKVCHFLETLDVTSFANRYPEEDIDKFIQERIEKAKVNILKNLELFVRSYMIKVQEIPLHGQLRYEISIPWLVTNNGSDLIAEAVKDGFNVECVNNQGFWMTPYPEYSITLPEVE